MYFICTNLWNLILVFYPSTLSVNVALISSNILLHADDFDLVIDSVQKLLRGHTRYLPICSYVEEFMYLSSVINPLTLPLPAKGSKSLKEMFFFFCNEIDWVRIS